MKIEPDTAADPPERVAKIRGGIRASFAGRQNAPSSHTAAHADLCSVSQALDRKAETPHDYRSFATSDFEGNRDLSSADELTVMLLMASISDRGVLRAPLVQERSDESGLFQVVSGRLRLEAVMRLGLPFIVCRVIGGSDLDAELAELDEELVRKNTNLTETAEILGRRTRIYKALSGRKATSGVRAAFARVDRPGPGGVPPRTTVGPSEPNPVRERWLDELRHVAAEIERINGGGAPPGALALDTHAAIQHVVLEGADAEAVFASVEPVAETATHHDNRGEGLLQNIQDQTKAPTTCRLQDEIERLSDSLALQRKN